MGANIEWESSNFQTVVAALILNLAILQQGINWWVTASIYTLEGWTKAEPTLKTLQKSESA